MPAKPQNDGMIQLVYRDIDEDEKLSVMDLYGISIFTDENKEVVCIDVPPGYTSHVVGADLETLDKL